MNFTMIAVALQNRATDVRQSVRANRPERGAAMAEYGMLLALVALVAVAVLAMFGGEIVEVFTEAEDTLNTRDDIPPPD